MHVLYCTFGNHFHHHLQAAFSALSFMQQPNDVKSINIITDAVPYYQHMSKHVNIIPVTADTITDWKGKANYFFRVKIKAIQHLAAMYPGEPIIYCDTDTFLFSKLSSLKTELLSGKSYMHEDEGALSQRTGKHSVKTWNAIKGKEYGGLLMKPSDHMRNAGVVAFPNTQNGKDVAMALQICDEMINDGVPLFLIEQYSFSLTMQHFYTVGDSTPWIAHYWRNKQDWNPFILNWIAEQQFKQKTFDEIITEFAQLDLSQVPVIIKRKYTAEKWHRAVDWIFPPSNMQYVKRNM
ncbi:MULTISPECIES: hypothetical protein [Niastella]|uniref:Nucleotide-diphospho-sugar transferase domain-containing protein n=1 Tax=Niastella soli TaxID=2821487 RepID=A0ABS3YPV5_9BACT|nr:hypothetical protein [Niastella soli]MBO9199934.1 hypothetical protein [Niastella soli]